MDQMPQIIMLSEAWIEDYELENYKIPNYYVLAKYWKHTVGGVIVW